MLKGLAGLIAAGTLIDFLVVAVLYAVCTGPGWNCIV